MLSPPHKLFPLKLPKDFHGPVKSDTGLSRANKLHVSREIREASQPQLQKRDLRVSGWDKGRSDKEVNKLQREFIQHPSLISKDNPQMFKNTLYYYQRSVHKYSPHDKSKYNIFGDSKAPVDYSTAKFNLSSSNFYDRKPLSFSWSTPQTQTSSKVSTEETRQSFWKPREFRVTGKIGGESRRSKPKDPTVLKIGHCRQIDTYGIS